MQSISTVFAGIRHLSRQLRLRVLAALVACLACAVPSQAAPANGCQNLLVYLTNSSSTALDLGYVNCTTGYEVGIYPSGSLVQGAAEVLVLQIYEFKGPSCQFNINVAGTPTVYATVTVNQVPCQGSGGNIQYSSTGPATITAVNVGNFGFQLPGMVWVNIN